MFSVLKNSWALFFGMMLLMLGNGLQGTLLGVRGAIEGFDPSTMSWIMAGYFVGFLGGSQLAPEMIRRVGHVRVFAALASFISACLILYAAWPNEYFWFFLRVMVGFCFSGVYVVAESWLNNAATNETRGQTLSLYLIVQMIGIVMAQGVLNFADPSGFMLFIIVSVVVSFSFAPILLSVTPAPQFTTTKRMKLRELYRASPLGFVGNFLLGSIFAALFGMAAVYGTEKGLKVSDISIFVATIYLGGMVLQIPIGWFSDRMDRRLLIVFVTGLGCVTCLMGVLFPDNFVVLLIVAFFVGGTSNPLYSLYIAYTNDFLEHDDMAAASGGMIFINGVGAVLGPVLLGWLMSSFGANVYFGYIGAIMGLMMVYALYRMTQRAAPGVEDTSAYAAVSPAASPIAVEAAQEYAIETALEEEAMHEHIDALLHFWAEEVGPKGWYSSSPELDEQIRTTYLSDYNAAIAGELSDWEKTPNGALALTIVLDQFPRNMFRDQRKAFEADPIAREVAERAIKHDYDLKIEGDMQQFFYLPFMHSEDLSDQDYAIDLFHARMPGSNNLLHARAHREVIDTYGRFPFRNEALGRRNTSYEKRFMEAGGYSKVVEELKATDAE